MTGIYPPTSGEVRFEGRPLTGLPARKVTSRGLARTFQNIRLFREMTALENVMVGRHVRTRAGWFRTVLRTPGFRREERSIEERSKARLDFVGRISHCNHVRQSRPWRRPRAAGICV